MSTDELARHNKALLQEIFAGVAQGDSSLFFAHLADDVTLTITGENSWSQVFVGKERITKDLFGYLRSRLAARGSVHAFHFLADGEWVVVEARGDMRTRAGERYANHYCLMYRVVDDLIVEAKEYQDSATAERLLGTYPAELRRAQPEQPHSASG
jgi:ketosteroid isomerase-like protein